MIKIPVLILSLIETKTYNHCDELTQYNPAMVPSVTMCVALLFKQQEEDLAGPT